MIDLRWFSKRYAKNRRLFRIRLKELIDGHPVKFAKTHNISPIRLLRIYLTSYTHSGDLTKICDPGISFDWILGRSDVKEVTR